MTRTSLLSFFLVSVVVVCGCWSSQADTGPVVAGPYEVTVVDGVSGVPVEGAVVSWNYYFTSTQVDPAQREDWGLSSTSSDGTATIPAVRHPWGDSFVEVNVRATAGGYHEGRISTNLTGGEIIVRLKPVGR